MLSFLKKPTLAHADKIEAAIKAHGELCEACIFLLESEHTWRDRSNTSHGLREAMRHMRHNGNIALSSSRGTCEMILRDFRGGIREVEAMLVVLADHYETHAGVPFHKSVVDRAKADGWTAYPKADEASR